jgi:predicted porin
MLKLEGETLMKKQLIALAVAGAMTAPMIAQADATLYGSFRMGIAKTDDGDLDVVDTSSRIGIKGTVDLGLDSAEGFFKAEWQAIGTDDADQTDALRARQMLTGLRGDWGTLILGKQWLPHALWIQHTTAIFHPGDGGYGERFNLGNTANGKAGHFLKRTEGALTYHSPVMNGFQFVGGVVLLGDNDDNDNVADDDIDAYNLAFRYSANGFTGAISYGELNVQSGAQDQDTENLGVALKYKANALEVMAKYEEEQYDLGGVEQSDEEVIELAVRYTVNGTAFYARVAEYDENVADTDLTQYGVGVSHKMGKGIVYLEYFDNDSDDTANPDRILAGYRLDF